jgi:hypothetical protein
MSTTPPSGPGGDDEVLSFLDKIAHFLQEIIKGIFTFFGRRIPEWIRDVIRGFLEHIWEYVQRFVRIIVRVVRVAVLTVVLIAVVIGPGLLLYHTKAPEIALPIWVALIAGALVYAVQRYARKEFERRKQARAARTGRTLVCKNCRTAHAGPIAPPICSYCKEKWIGVEV